jgi:predicted glutamine amidotransferase
MCRWVAYFGAPVRPEEILYDASHSLIEQSRRAVRGLVAEDGTVPAPFTNGDGFGLGWYGSREEPGVYRNVMPAWGDPNLRNLAGQIETSLFLAHVRAATGTPVQQTNSHPFRYGRWLFVHNGFVAEFEQLRHDMILAIDPRVFQNLQGSTDSELLFHLALTFGLEEDPLGGLERMAGFVEALGRSHGIDEPLQMTIGLTNGERIYAVRYASGPAVNSLYISRDARDMRTLCPEMRFERLTDDTRAIVSEPIDDLPFWVEVPPGSAVIVQPGDDDHVPFTPQPPATLSRQASGAGSTAA